VFPTLLEWGLRTRGAASIKQIYAKTTKREPHANAQLYQTINGFAKPSGNFVKLALPQLIGVQNHAETSTFLFAPK
jgi:hypothetical protein